MCEVSVIVPVYNVEKYLPKCLDSLVNQTFKDFEIIIINDGSPDNSQKIIDKYVKKYKFIKSIKQENMGLSDARNNGLKYAKGKYILFVDSDDFVNPTMIEKMYNKIISDNLDMVICGNNVVKENDEIISDKPLRLCNNLTLNVILNDMCAWNKLIKKELITKNKLKFRSRVWYEDLDYSFKLLTLTNKIGFVNENLYNYLVRGNSIMNAKNVDRNKEIILTIDEMINYCKKNNIYDKYHDIIEYFAIDNVYISAMVRVINSNTNQKDKKTYLNLFTQYIKDNFKDYKENQYLKYLSKNRKIILKLIELKQYWLVRLIFIVKDR